MNQTDKNLKKLKKELEKNNGINVEFERKKLSPRREMNDVIDRIGKDLAPVGMTYAGSNTIFMYVSNTTLHQTGGQIATATNFTSKVPLGLMAVKSMLESAKVDILEHYMPSFEADKTEGV